jgi:dihydroxyacetone kinase
MSYVLNDPANFADESATGFLAAHRNIVRRVPGGVARTNSTPQGQVALVIGGGSGHYPAFAGLVGTGLAHAAAMGNVFASPSAQQVYNAAKSVSTDAGVLLSYGNYAGDVLNFDIAQARLLAEGIPCRTVRVTDDIYSAPPSERYKRRGVAGDLVVFRAAAWAAEQGRSLEDVEALAARANERTRSFGVAFSGCTLPGATEPLFTVPAGQMAVGMGIHGEPGIDVRPVPTAAELGSLFVENLLEERPDDIPQAGGARVGVILNGLGAVKGEELFVIYSTVAHRLEEEGITIVEPEVGEYATSFEMAGVSLTLVWLDDELEAAWTSPAYSPAYRKGARSTSTNTGPVPDEQEAAQEDAIAAASPEAAEAGRSARAFIDAIRAVIDREVDELGRLDSIAGDGDHGIGMQRGVHAAAHAAAEAADAEAGVGTVLSRAGDAWADKAGGTSGALWGAALRAAGERIGDDARPTAAAVAAGVTCALEKIQLMGKAEVGDKTLVDALVPFAGSLSAHVASGHALAASWTAAARDATAAAVATAELLPRLGRARPHMHKSLGTPDPGAISLALAMTAAAEVLTRNVEREGE